MRENWKPVVIVVISVLGSLAVSMLTWKMNEDSRRKHEEYMRKEARYSGLISCLRGFHATSDTLDTTYDGKELRAKFIDELNLCWLYCPDAVIREGYKFAHAVMNDSGAYTAKDRDDAWRELMVAVRTDLIDRRTVDNTDLTPQDFKILKAK